jgi:hypothetical protein
MVSVESSSGTGRAKSCNAPARSQQIRVRFVLETLTERSSQHSVLRANAKHRLAIAAVLRPVSRMAALSETLPSAPSGVRSAKDKFRYQRD